MARAAVNATRPSFELPPVSRKRLQWFARYVAWYLRRNFHGLHLLRLADLQPLQHLPVLVCLNHPSWWDPLVALHLSQRFFANREQYAPIAAGGLAKYKFFERLGFFGIEPGTRAGATRFLTIGQAVLNERKGVLWVTPQGEFTDVREPVRLQPGVGHLAHRLKEFVMLPVALEYAFWNERYPEAFACLGQPVTAQAGSQHSAVEWNEVFTAAVAAAQDALSHAVKQRNAQLFEPLLHGGAGVGGVYDLWRASKARLRGKAWQPEHGSHSHDVS